MSMKTKKKEKKKSELTKFNRLLQFLCEYLYLLGNLSIFPIDYYLFSRGHYVYLIIILFIFNFISGI